MFYVNNSSFSVGSTSFSITDNELTAAHDLVNTYIVILDTRSVLNAVIEDAGIDCSYEQLKSMIDASAVNNTEVFSVTITDTDPSRGEKIANSIAKVLPQRISEVVEGSSVRIVDYAVLPSEKSAPNITMYTAIGMLLGVLVSCFIIVVIELLDKAIRSGEYLLQQYNIPVLGAIPDLNAEKTSKSYAGAYQRSNQYLKDKGERR